MLNLSWQITVVSLVMLPVFVIPAKRVGARLQAITRESYQLNASMNTTMTERFNVSGALLVKLFGRPDEEAVVLQPGRPGARHRHPVRDVRADVLHRPDAGRVARDRARLRPRRLAHSGHGLTIGTVVALAPASSAGSTARSPRCPTSGST